MKKLLSVIFIISLFNHGKAQNVPDATKEALKHQRFLQAFNAERAADSIWFYSMIEESYAVNKSDTTYWIVKTPRRIITHEFKDHFDIQMKIIDDSSNLQVTNDTVNYNFIDYKKHFTNYTSTVVDSSFNSFTENRNTYSFNDTTTNDIHENKPDITKNKVTKKKATYLKGARYTKFVGYYPALTYIPGDYQMPQLPENVNPDTVAYFVVRCDAKSAAIIFKNIKL
jgi:hypothetical protein